MIDVKNKGLLSLLFTPPIIYYYLREKTMKAIILIRLTTGAVFLSEGIQKFLFPAELGVGRFIKIGIPLPEVLAPFVGVVEIVCGLLFIFGLLTRPAAIPLIIDMVVAIYTTKIPILLKSGFWVMAHESRVDYAMILCSVFLMITGAGAFSLDALWAYKKMFTFEDIMRVNDRGVQNLLKHIEPHIIATALKKVPKELKEKFFRNMSKKSAGEIQEFIDFMGPIRISDIEKAQQRIVNMVSRCYRRGELIIENKDGSIYAAK